MSDYYSDLEFEQAELGGNAQSYIEETKHGITVRRSFSDGRENSSAISLEFAENTARQAVRQGASYLYDLIKATGKGVGDVLIVGIGNGYMTSDSLGSRVVSAIVKEGMNIKTLLPSVEGVTGIPSDLLVRCVVKECNIGMVIAVDSLCAGAYRRIGKVVQMTNRGLMAGSALTRGRAYNSDTIGVPVIAVGVPVVVSINGILREHSAVIPQNNVLDGMIVAPKDVDRVIDNSAKLVFNIIKRALS